MCTVLVFNTYNHNYLVMGRVISGTPQETSTLRVDLVGKSYHLEA